jgi:hypothetical protein
MDSFKPNSSDSLNQGHNQFKLGLSYGAADHDISVIGAYIEYNKAITTKLGIDAKITMLSQKDDFNSEFGLSDIFINANYRVGKAAIITLGTKIPLTNGNSMKDGRPLPMDFQSSLGTFDLILGIGYKINRFQVIMALQQPLTQNDNAFIADDYPLESEFRNYQSTNKYKRGGDILLRLSYPMNIGNKFKFTPSLLPIYHLTNDKFTDTDGIEKEIDGSQGLTLNANIYFDFQLNEKSSLQLNAGAPMVIRDARPDGLTRHFIVSFEYRIKF